MASFSSYLVHSRPPSHGSTTIVRQAPAIGHLRSRHAWGASSLTARPQLRLPAPWKLTRANGHGGMARRRAVTVTCHCALPRPCQGAPSFNAYHGRHIPSSDQMPDLTGWARPVASPPPVLG